MKTVNCIPCKICSAPSTGFHYGALTCEACKAFFRRVLKSGAAVSSLSCAEASTGGEGSSEHAPSSTDTVASSPPGGPPMSVAAATGDASAAAVVCDLMSSAKKCPKCRFNRCLQVGMSPEASKIGRPTKCRLQEFRDELHKFSEETFIFPKAEPKEQGEDDTAACPSRQRPVFDKSKRSLAAEAANIKHERIAMTFKSRRRRRSKRGPKALARVQVVGEVAAVTPSQTFFDEPLRMNSADSVASTNNYVDVMLLETNSDDNLCSAMNISEDSFCELLRADSVPLSNRSATSSLDQMAFLEPPQPAAQIMMPVKCEPVASSSADFDVLTDDAGKVVSGFYNISEGRRNRGDFINTLRKVVMICKKPNIFWMYGSAERWYSLADIESLSSDPLPFDEDPLELYSRYLVEKDTLSASPPMMSNMDSVVYKVVQACRYLFLLNAVPTDVGAAEAVVPNMTFFRWFGKMMQLFEAECIHLVAFTRSLPGFYQIDNVNDRVLLSAHSIYPLMLATLSLDFDVSQKSPRTFWMSGETLNLVMSTFPEVKPHYMSYNQHFVDSGVALKSANLTVVEFGFLCALLYFNPNLAGLENRVAVARLWNELMATCQMFIRSNFEGGYGFDGDKSSSHSSDCNRRIRAFENLVRFFQKANEIYSCLTAEFLTNFPSLVESSGEIFKEMASKIFSHFQITKWRHLSASE